MSLIILSFLISISFWLWIIRKYDRFEREPIKTVLFVLAIGGLLSVFPAGIFNEFFSFVIRNYIYNGIDGQSNIEKSWQFYGFVGINEETLKAFATVILIRRKKAFNEPVDGLVYGMSVALGFSVFENIAYLMKFGFLTFFIRQFNAVPLHIGLAAIWGIGIAKAKFLGNGKYFRIMAPYVLFAALIHAVYNSSTILPINPILNLVLLSALGFMLIWYATRKIKRYSKDGPFANRLFCHSCGTVNFLHERSCKKCGQKFDLEFYVLCPDCNDKVIENAESCPKCGTKLLSVGSTPKAT